MGLFSEGLIIGGNFVFQNGLGLTISIDQNTKDNGLKQLKRANSNSP